jgi:hypothetical protein
MKILSALTAACFLTGLTVAPAAEPSKDSEQQVAALTKEVQAQQTAILENQTKINEKVVTVAEALRMAKIYASRSGR